MKQKVLNKIIIVAMFSALCCACTFVQIRMPAGDFVHLGNFVMIMAALLLGGVEGGLVGFLGMGLYDLIFYTSKPSTILRTFILKFIIGFLVGYLFRLVLKKKTNTKVLFGVLSGLFFVVFVLSLIFFVKGDASNLSFSNGLNSVYSATIFGSVKKISISLYIPIFSAIFAIGLLVAMIFSFKLKKRQSAALFAVTIAIFVNIVGEFFLRWFLEGIMVSDFKTSLAVATSKIPGSLITGFISVVLSILIYEPIYRALKNTSYFKDDTLEEETNDSEVEENEVR